MWRIRRSAYTRADNLDPFLRQSLVEPWLVKTHYFYLFYTPWGEWLSRGRRRLKESFRTVFHKETDGRGMRNVHCVRSRSRSRANGSPRIWACASERCRSSFPPALFPLKPRVLAVKSHFHLFFLFFFLTVHLPLKLNDCRLQPLVRASLN